MKKLTRLSAVLLVLLLLVSTIAPAAFAAADATVQPGETAKLTLDLGNVYGINGEFTVSNEDDFTVTLSGEGVSGKKCYFFSQTTEATKLTYTATVVAKASAADGDSCTVTLKYEDWNATGDTATERTITKTVVVDIPEDPSKPTEPSKPSEPTEPTKPTTPDTPATKPTEPGKQLDKTELNKQIKLGNAVTPNGYTDASWANLMAALENANKALSSGNQAVIDKAAAELAAAIAGMEKMDYTKLEQAISKSEELLNNPDLGQIGELIQGIMDAQELLKSNNQADVDAGAKKLEELSAALEEALKQMQGEEEPTEPTEPVDPAPQGEYCNISMHYVWPILFFISLAVNIVFVVLLARDIIKRKKNQQDNTPLVDYDIDKDA